MSNNKIKFAIWAPHFSFDSGGLIALGKLAHNLTNLGEKAYLISPNKNENWLGELAGPEIVDDNTFMIYPEIIAGNPFNAKNVVRWALNTPGLLGGDPNSWQPSDMVYKFADYFTVPDEENCLGLLTAFDLQLQFWTNFNRQRNGEAYLVRKGHYKQLDMHAPNSQRIDGYDNYAMREAFNNKEFLLCYDSECWTVIQAALCGCIPIVIPKDGVSAEEWKEKFPYFKYGISYGLDDVKWAVNTQHLTKDNLLQLESESIVQARKFVEDCKERLNGNNKNK